jgi:hypothetical protein
MYGSALMLTEVLDELSKTVESAPRAARTTGRVSLSDDVLELATLHARAAGSSVEDYLRAAVRAYGGGPVEPPATEAGRSGARGGDDRSVARRRRDRG